MARLCDKCKQTPFTEGIKDGQFNHTLHHPADPSLMLHIEVRKGKARCQNVDMCIHCVIEFLEKLTRPK